MEPPEAMNVKIGPNHDKPAHRESRRAFYDWLATTITINGIQSIERDLEFDNESYRSGGIRLYYPETTGTKSVFIRWVITGPFDNARSPPDEGGGDASRRFNPAAVPDRAVRGSPDPRSPKSQ
ncbi:hypothetical protein [Ensifer canadensis]|uniref:hypothetical protein n=1 Tax=Ensifer canadensis TaxID=555315 RepID=UPI00307D234D